MSNRIHIALLADCLENFAGGAEKQIYELAKGLNKSKYRVSVISLDCQGRASREAIEAIGCEFAVFRVTRIYGLSGFIQGRRFLHFLKQNHVDILQTYHFSSDIWGTFWAHLAGVKKIVSNRRDMGFWRKGLHVRAYRLINPWVTKIVAVANSVKELIVETEKVSEHKVEVIYNGIEQSSAFSSQLSAASLKEQLGISERDTVIAHVANLKPVKGHSFLLQAMAGVVKEFSNVKLFLVGKDEMNGELQRLAGELNIQDNVIFLGRRDDVPTILALSYFCVLTSLSEGMSNAILEYMLAGKAVVATRVGGNSELVRDGWNGLLVPGENVEQLKEALITLCLDPDKQKIFGKNGYSMILKDFGMERMLQSYDRMLDGLAGGRPKRILHLVSSGGLFGAERVILHLASADSEIVQWVGAVNNRHNSHLEVLREAGSLGIKTVAFDSRGRFDLATVFKIARFMKHNDIDIIHTHNYKADILGFLAGRLAGRKWAATNHVWHGTDTKLQLYERIDAFVLRSADRIFAVSDEIRNELLDKNIRDPLIKVVYNGIEPERFKRIPVDAALRSSLGIGREDAVVTIVGRLSREKGHRVFLKAAKLVLEKYPHVWFLVVGDGPLGEELKAEAGKLDITGNVIFAGVRSDMPQIYSLSSMMVNGSYIEGLPMTILEAMASELPVIATRVGGTPVAIQNGVNGLLLEPGDAESLARAIIRFIEDPGESKGFAEQALRDVRAKFSAAAMAEQYFTAYREIFSLKTR